MQSRAPQKRVNPLTSYMRQPKIYITLPSGGEYWPKGSLELTETGEFPVYSMTAKDELIFKTPDALLNGQGMVDVMQSCMPNIKNAWDIPVIDLDVILIAIRLATYGDKMAFKHIVPGTNEEAEFEIDLRVLLDNLQNNHWIDQVVINDDFVVYVRPLTYRHMTKTSIKTFETQRIFNVVNDDSIPEEQKIELFNASFNKLTQVSIDLVADSIYRIDAGDQTITDAQFIKEFVANSDKDVFEQVQNHIKSLKEHNEIKPLEFESTPEQIEAGAPEKYRVPLNFDQSDFFAKGF